MKRHRFAGAPAPPRKPLRRSRSLRRTESMAATDRQRRGRRRACVVCGADRRIDPAHLIPRSLGGCGDPLCSSPPVAAPPRLRPRRAGSAALPGAGVAGAARPCGRARRVDRGAPANSRYQRTTDVVLVPETVAGAGGVSFAGVSEHRSATNAKPVEDRDGIWAPDERIRLAELRADSERPMGELLEEGVELSRFASELADTARTGA